MRPTDIETFTQVGALTVDPDGSRAVVAVSYASLAADATVGQLWELPLGDEAGPGGARRLTRGRRDLAPRFSPDGRLLAFLRAVPGGKPQVHVVDARGGEPLAVTDQPLGVSDLAWSPDSARIAFVAAVPEPGRYGTVDGLGPDAEPARRITTVRYSGNGRGYTIDKRSHVFVVDVPDVAGEPSYEPAPDVPAEGGEDAAGESAVPVARRATHVDTDHGSPVFTADGERLLVIAALHDGRDTDLRTDVWSFPVPAGDADDEPAGEPVRVTGDENLDVGAVTVGPDGLVWFTSAEMGGSGRDFVARTTAAYVVEPGPNGWGEPRRVTDPAQHDLALAGSDAGLVAVPGAVLVVDRSRGRGPVLRVDADGEVTTVLDGDLEATGLAVGGGTLAVGVVTPASAGDVVAVALDDDHRPVGAPRALTDLGGAARASGVVVPVEEEHPSADGTPVHGWVAVPDGRAEGSGPHPVLLMIHGGPFAQYTVGLFDETQVYTSAGYAVVYCNPRGSAGYGREHGLAIKERMGTVDLEDVLGFLDGVLAAHPELDADRVGILGGSYGGYLTAWTVAHDHRFAAAVVERGFLDPEAFIGTSDIGSFFSEEYTGADPAHRAAQSPQAVVGQVRTPTLVVHSEQDLRCPLSQAERYYAALRRGGVDSELLVFPGENHELSRAGRPRHRVQRFDAILDWFGRYLPV
ncbi:S9 family peptidase [Luteimicrobium sp. DT211]|uniref:S9 family peptidase n=1 Tax=Luteimicrobium sp. DT211 TaxID=3393412 RepID=UPI003CF63A63